jgi:hypothetical protein
MRSSNGVFNRGRAFIIFAVLLRDAVHFPSTAANARRAARMPSTALGKPA